MADILLRPIGTIHTPFPEPAGTPIQPAASNGAEGTITILPEYEAALRDLDGFSHVILIYHLHRTGPFRPLVVPFLDDVEHGLFATRSPARPNPIGLSVVELVELSGPVVRVRGIDVVDGTPLLDLKPYVPEFDARGPCRTGWFEGRASRAAETRADDRFRRG